MTPAINYLKKIKSDFKIHSFEHDQNSKSYGKEASIALNVDEKKVFKTLLSKNSAKNEFFVFVIPVDSNLNLKKAAKAAKVKKVEMARPEDAEKITGYIVGGISPVAQKKKLKTFIDTSAMDHETILVSAGKRGLEIEISPEVLKDAIRADIDEIKN